MDECTQASEGVSLVPLSSPGLKRVVFVGDEKQLGPVSEVKFLQQSMFERILKNGSYAEPLLLKTQYRMHSTIVGFSNKRYYKGKLQNGTEDTERRIDGLEPLSFIDYGFDHLEKGLLYLDPKKVDKPRGFSQGNFGECELVCEVLNVILNEKHVERHTVGVITPYSFQREVLAKMIQRDGRINPRRAAIDEEIDVDTLATGEVQRENKKKRKQRKNTHAESTVKTIDGLMVSSVDAFQGREKDVIVYCCVRSNGEGDIGFLKDERRHNVALTRARKALVVISNMECLTKQSWLWRKFVEYVGKHTSVMGPDQFIDVGVVDFEYDAMW